MTSTKRSLLLGAATAIALIFTACVPPPSTGPAPLPPSTTVPAPVVPKLCSESGRDPAGALLSPVLEPLTGGARAVASLEEAPPEPVDPSETPTPLDAGEVRSAAELIAAEPQALQSSDNSPDASLVVMTLSALIEGRPLIRTVANSDPDAAVTEASDVASLVRAAGGEVVAVEGDAIVETDAAASYPVNDTYRDEQWSFDRFDFEDTWCASTGSGVTVAVVDSGVDAGHPDLAGKVVSQVDMSLDPLLGNGDAGKPGLHGTHVAGTIAAIPNNAIGVAGVAPGVEILDVKALTSGQGLGTQGFTANAIVHAVDEGADVINLSVGFSCDQTADGTFHAQDPNIEFCATGNGAAALQLAARYAKQNDVVMVVAAGNDGSATAPGAGGEVPNPTRNIWNVPGSLDWSLAVGSMAQDDTMSPFSTQASYVDVAGPGSDVLSTVFDDEGATYDLMSGTSMATPHVAGLVAVLRGAFPSEDAARIIARVTGSAASFGTGDTADDSDGCPVGTSKAWCFGAGVIDPASAVRLG